MHVINMSLTFTNIIELYPCTPSSHKHSVKVNQLWMGVDGRLNQLWIGVCGRHVDLILSDFFFILLHDYNVCINGCPCYNVGHYNYNST